MKFFALVMLVAIFGITTIQCEPEPMARPTRQKVFNSAEELRRYIVNLTNELKLSRPRFGKRAGDTAFPAFYLGYPWNTLRFILDTHRHFQEQKEDRSKPIKGQVTFRNFQDTDTKKQIFRNNLPEKLSDMIDKYYDDVE
ncbi:neuropeptide Y-like [Vespula squamosa]|uniref:Neuropeptide Y-like n=1 Tax=Vespula squamosa TaxID=30214 RepID=A0ABD2AG61_VESSQ